MDTKDSNGGGSPQIKTLTKDQILALFQTPATIELKNAQAEQRALSIAYRAAKQRVDDLEVKAITESNEVSIKLDKDHPGWGSILAKALKPSFPKDRITKGEG